MRFLFVADRELRAAARQKATYRARWVTATIFFGLLVWMLYVFHGFTNPWAAPMIFKTFSVLSFVHCLFLSTARTADSISAERREGTLGLLFLTNLNSAEIIAGKLCSTALASVYGLLAIFPILALPLLMGGTTFGHFGRVVLALVNGSLSGLAVGFLASVVCKRQFTAIALALGLTITLAGGVMLGAIAADSYVPTRPLAPWLAAFSPLYTVIAADTARFFWPTRFWASVAAVACVALGCLALATLLLACTWRDRPQSVRRWHWTRFWRRSERPFSAQRAALRRRLLAINPLFWLASRQPVSAPVVMVLAVVLTTITVCVTVPFFGRIVGGGQPSTPVLAQLVSWLCTGLMIHALVLYYAANTASQRLAEDRQTGALELILSTPTTERVISRGLWLAYGRQMLFPALLAVLVHWFFIWVCVVMATLAPPGDVPAGATPSEIFWTSLLDQPLRGRMLEWQFGFILRIAVLLLLLLMVVWVTLGWVGRWLGVRLKHPGFAPMAALALVFVPPILLFTLACYLANKFHLDRLPSRQFASMLMWLAFAIGVGHCLLLSAWAATGLRERLRAIAMSRYQPLPSWRWRLPRWHTVRRVALGTAASATGVALLVGSYYGYQNWHSRRAWRAFQTVLQRNGESLTLAPLLPAPVPAEANLARSPAFLALGESTGLFKQISPFDLQPTGSPGQSVLMEWRQQTNAPLHRFVNRTKPPPKGGSRIKREDEAAALLQSLEPQKGRLREVAAAAARLPAFQTSTNCDAGAVFKPERAPVLTLARLHLLFQVRACAALALDRNAPAAEDTLTGLRLAHLARQLPDAGSTWRVQSLLTRSLQPLWEGLGQHAWTEPELAALQHELANFNLLADFTNSVHRVVLTHIALWHTVPDHPQTALRLPGTDGAYLRQSAWELQPRAWWFQSCIQLHNAGQNSIEQVDLGTGRVQPARNWADLDGLPLDAPSRELLQRGLWSNANPQSLAFVQTSVNQATIACALERFRLAHRRYPETLGPLVPALLDRIPRDAVSGRPLIYQFLPDGSFILRGVGPNGIDDRKTPGSDDWLWTYSTNTSSAKQ